MAIISVGHRGGAGRYRCPVGCAWTRAPGLGGPPLTRMKRWTTAVAVVAALTLMTGGGAAAVAKQEAAHPSLQQLQAQAAALRVQINLSRAQLSAVMAEMRRLNGLVSTEQAI